MQKRARITSKGQITIPRDIRRALGVRSGDSLIFECDAKGVRVCPVRVESRFDKYRGIGNPGIPFRQERGSGLGAEASWKMTTVIDTNVLVALWDQEHALNSPAQSSLDEAFRRGSLVVPAPVYAELMAGPGRSETFLDSFFQDTGIIVDWSMDEAVWRAAGLAFQNYVVRRRKQRNLGARRILADFVIGAYARERRYRLLTLDDHFYRISFPDLPIAKV